jgi:hypothetical protein
VTKSAKRCHFCGSQKVQADNSERAIVHLKLLPGLVEDYQALAERLMVS